MGTKQFFRFQAQIIIIKKEGAKENRKEMESEKIKRERESKRERNCSLWNMVIIFNNKGLNSFCMSDSC